MPAWKKMVLHGSSGSLAHLKLENLTSQSALGTDSLGNVVAGSVSGYSLPTATSSVLGGIKIGGTLAISSGILNARTYIGASEAAFGEGEGGGAAGVAGYVPTASAAQYLSFLRGDGTWQTPTNTVTRLRQSGGTLAAGDFTFAGSGATTVSFAAGIFTISSTDTNTTYSVGDGGLSEKNFTATLKTKLDGIATSADNYSSWTISDSVRSEAIRSGDTLTIRGSGATSVTYDIATNVMVVSSTDTDTNTTYTAGTGLTLTDTTFSVTTNTYAAAAHSHAIRDITDLQTALDSKQVAGSYAASSHTHDDRYLKLTETSSFFDRIIDSAPGTLDTLNELAAAIGDDANFSASIAGVLARKSDSTHTHAISAVTGLQTALDGKQVSGDYAASSHTHAISAITGLQTALDGKQASGNYSVSGHTHSIRDVTDLQTTLDGKQASLGFTPYNATNPSGFITGYTETDTLNSVTGRGASTANNITLSGGGNTFNGHHYFSAYDANGNHYPHYNAGSSANGSKLNLRMFDSSGTVVLFHLNGNSKAIEWNGYSIWHAGSLTNLNQLSNGPGYITSYVNTVTSVGVSGDLSTGDVDFRGGGATTISKSGGTITISSTDTDTNTTYTAGTGLTLTGTTFSVTSGTYAAASHNHDDRYYTETEADARFVLNDFGAQTAATAEDEKSGTWYESSGDTSWGTYKPGDDSTAGYSYNDAPGYVQYNIPTGYTTAYIGQLRWNSGGYFDVHAVMLDGSLVFRGRYLSKNSIENESHSGNHDGQQIIKISGLDEMRSLRITNQSGRLHLQGIGWSKEADTANTQVSETHWDLVYDKPSSFTPSSHTHTIGNVTGLQTALDGKQASLGFTPYNATNPSGYITSYVDTVTSVGISGDLSTGNVEFRGSGATTISKSGGTITINSTDTDTNTTYSAGTGLTLTGTTFSVTSGTYAASSHTHTIGNVTGLQTALDGKLGTSGKAADSETIDGIDSSRIVYGDGVRKSTSLSTMNSATGNVSGFFFYNQPTGNPFGDWTHWISSIGDSWDNNYGFQIAHAFHSDGFAVRRVTNGSFGSWRTIIDSGNIGSQSVNYAGSAGSVAWDNVSSKPTTFSPSAHTHTIGNVTGLQTALDGKQASGDYSVSGHTHSIRDVTDLQTTLDGKQASLGFTPYNVTNPSGFITSTSNISGNAATATNASTVGGITPIQFFNNMGDDHGTRTSFDASTPSYSFGFRFIQGNTNGPALGGGGQFYSWYLGLGNNYPATGAGSYGMHVAVPRSATTPYMSVRYNENNNLGSWIKIAAGYADSAGAVAWDNVSSKPTTFSPSAHTHTIGNVTGLQTALDGKQASGDYSVSGHTHSIRDVTDLQTTLDGKQASGNYAASSHTHDDRYYTETESDARFLILSGGTVTGETSFTKSTYPVFIYSYGNTAAVSAQGLQVYSSGGNGAIMAFHRGGYYAVNMGLDSDNVIRIGGWSAAANRMQLDMSGNVTFAGNVTGYSDARIKTDVKTIDNALEKVKQLRGVSFTRTDSDDRSTNIGVIAQEVLETVPEVVSQDASGMYNVAYGNMAGLFIEAIKQQQTLIEQQQKQIDQLKALVDGLTK